jgi:hypothetical protein
VCVCVCVCARARARVCVCVNRAPKHPYCEWFLLSSLCKHRRLPFLQHSTVGEGEEADKQWGGSSRLEGACKIKDSVQSVESIRYEIPNLSTRAQALSPPPPPNVVAGSVCCRNG